MKNPSKGKHLLIQKSPTQSPPKTDLTKRRRLKRQYKPSRTLTTDRERQQWSSQNRHQCSFLHAPDPPKRLTTKFLTIWQTAKSKRPKKDYNFWRKRWVEMEWVGRKTPPYKRNRNTSNRQYRKRPFKSPPMKNNNPNIFKDKLKNLYKKASKNNNPTKKWIKNHLQFQQK